MTPRQKQCLLQYLGYYTENIDGLWGDASKEATAKFQKAYGLTEDGIFGEGTAMRIKEVIAADEQPNHSVDIGSDSNANTGGGDANVWASSKYFKRAEFRCTCNKYCNGFPVEPDALLVKVVNEIRRRADVPISIVDAGGSGVRCTKHNAEVGGVYNSEHLYGRAADLHSELAPSKLKAIAEQVLAEMCPGKGGIGLYNWGVHVDVGKYSRWTRLNG